MKRILGAAVVAVIAAGAGLAAPAATAAVPSDVVTSAEFKKVAYGDAISSVRSVFGTKGAVVDRYDVPGTVDDYVRVEFPTHSEGGTVEVDFLRRPSGTWYLVAKYAYWGISAYRTVDKATLSEFNKVRQGTSITDVRRIFGTNGTITEQYDAPGTKHDGVVVEWPTDSVDGWVQVYFTRSTSGTWRVDTRSAYWAVEVTPTSDTVTESEFDRVRLGSSINQARSTFGTAGTIGYFYDAPGTGDDTTIVGWPTPSPDGYVELEFTRPSSATWTVATRTAYWAIPAKVTTDVATEEEFGTLRDELESGRTVSLTEARRVFGSSGTVVYRSGASGTAADRLAVHWYTGAEGQDVVMSFAVSGGTWTAMSVDDIQGPWSGSAARRAMSSPTTVAPFDGVPERPTWELRDARRAG